MSFSGILLLYDRYDQHDAFGVSQWRTQGVQRFQRGSSNGLCVTRIRARGIAVVGPGYSLIELLLALLIRAGALQENTVRWRKVRNYVRCRWEMGVIR
jgi:hypothetical protein